jgi:hypothetical protein
MRMGETASNFSTLSWEGKVADNPKPYAITGTAKNAQGPLTEQDLAEFEGKMLKLFHEMAEKISREQIGHTRNDPET